MPQVARYYDIIISQTVNMSTIQITKNWQPEPTTNLVESNPVEEGKQLSTKTNCQYTASDLMGLTWTLFEEDW